MARKAIAAVIHKTANECATASGRRRFNNSTENPGGDGRCDGNDEKRFGQADKSGIECFHPVCIVLVIVNLAANAVFTVQKGEHGIQVGVTVLAADHADFATQGQVMPIHPGRLGIARRHIFRQMRRGEFAGTQGHQEKQLAQVLSEQAVVYPAFVPTVRPAGGVNEGYQS